MAFREGTNFVIELSFETNGVVIPPDTVPFYYVYKDNNGNEYVVSNKSGEFQNCFIKDGKMYARFENHGLQKGQIMKEIWLEYTINSVDKGDNFRNGKWRKEITVESRIIIK